MAWLDTSITVIIYYRISSYYGKMEIRYYAFVAIIEWQKQEII